MGKLFVWVIPSTILVSRGKELEKIFSYFREGIEIATTRLTYADTPPVLGEETFEKRVKVIEPNRLNYSPNLKDVVASIRPTLKKEYPNIKVRVDPELTPFHISLFRY